MLQEAIHFSFIKICVCFIFFLWYDFFVLYALRDEKNYQQSLDAGLLGFQFLRPRGYLTSPSRILSPCFGVIGKTQGPSPVIILFKKFVWIGHRDNVFARSDSIFLGSGVKDCGTKRAHNFLFPKSSFRIPRSTVLGMLRDSALILDAIRRSFLTKSTTATMYTSLRVHFELPPLSSSSTSYVPSWNRECHLKTFDWFRASFSHKRFEPILAFLSQIDWLWNKILWQLCSFLPSMTQRKLTLQDKL